MLVVVNVHIHQLSEADMAAARAELPYTFPGKCLDESAAYQTKCFLIYRRYILYLFETF